MIYRLEHMFPGEVEARLAARPLLVIPFGTLEWHSYHLPLGLDGLAAQAIAERIAEQSQGVLAPLSYWAVGGVPYPYTLNLGSEVIEPLYRAAFAQFAAMGFRVIVAFTGHFGLEQTLTIKRAALDAMEQTGVTLLAITDYDLVSDLWKGDHAAVGETSLLMAAAPELVRLGAVAPDQALDGVLGPDPRGQASAEHGAQLIEAISSRAAEVALRLLEATSPVQRSAYMGAVRVGIRVLEKTAQQRRALPKAQVPSITTPAYLAHCQAIYQGDYQTAAAQAEEKLADLGA